MLLQQHSLLRDCYDDDGLYESWEMTKLLQSFKLPSKTEGSLSIYYELMNGLKNIFAIKMLKIKYI